MQYVVIGTSPFYDTSVGTGPFRSTRAALAASQELAEGGWNTEIVQLDPVAAIGVVTNDEDDEDENEA